MSDCIFCKIIKRESSARIVWENEKYISFLDKLPTRTGHILIVPKKCIESVFEMPEDMYTEIFQIARYLEAPLKASLGSKKVGLVIEGFGVSHAHIHLVPINSAGELDPNYIEKLSDSEFDEIACKIRNNIDKIYNHEAQRTFGPLA